MSVFCGGKLEFVKAQKSFCALTNLLRIISLILFISFLLISVYWIDAFHAWAYSSNTRLILCPIFM